MVFDLILAISVDTKKERYRMRKTEEDRKDKQTDELNIQDRKERGSRKDLLPIRHAYSARSGINTPP